MTDKVITFTDSNTGHVVRYRRYSTRLPEFLKQYSPKAGYRIKVEYTDLLSLQKGRLTLVREAVIAGNKPSEVGLPGVEDDVNTLVCTATLLDSQGRIVRSATASRKVLAFKDFEALETAANQRLLAALGFGGELFDEDEDRDLDRLEPSIRSTETASVSASVPRAATDASTSKAPAATSGSSALDDDEPVTTAEHQHIANLAKRANVKAPVLRTRADVRAAHQQLTALAKGSRGNGGAQKNASSG